MREELRNCAKYSFHPFGYLHIRVNSCTGRSLMSPFLSSLKLILGNSFQVSVIRIEYARYSCEYRIRKASQEYFKALPSLIFLPLSLTVTVQWFYLCVQPNTELALAALRFLRSTHSVRYFPFRGEWRLRSKRNLESSSYRAKYPDVRTKPNQLHLLIIRQKSERRRNLRILSKWKLRMKSTHPSQSRPPYTFTYVKKSTKISLPDSIVIIIATSIRCELQMLRIYFLASVWGSKGTRPRLVPLQL